MSERRRALGEALDGQSRSTPLDGRRRLAPRPAGFERDSVEVIDHDAGRHIATLPGFPEAAGVVADDGHVLVTNRGAATLAWVHAQTLETRTILKTGPRPNGVAIVSRQGLAIAACIGDDSHGPTLHVLSLDGNRGYSIDLPGRW